MRCGKREYRVNEPSKVARRSLLIPPEGFKYKYTRSCNARGLYLCLIILANATGFVALATAFRTQGMELVRWSLLVSALAGAGAGLVNWWLHRGKT